MKIYDITQELLSCEVYPGDASPQKVRVCDMSEGALYNLTNISLCTHNGTHTDAPFHFIKDGKTVDKIPLEKFIGQCRVVSCEGEIGEIDAKNIVRDERGNICGRILIKGSATVSAYAARVFADNEICLLGTELQSVGPEGAPMEVHKILLEKEVVLLEGIRLSEVNDGEYFLCSQPLNIAGSDGAPCRAVLIDFLR